MDFIDLSDKLLIFPAQIMYIVSLHAIIYMCCSSVSDCLRDLALSYQSEFLQTIVPTLVQAHGHFQDNNVSSRLYFWLFCCFPCKCNKWGIKRWIKTGMDEKILLLCRIIFLCSNLMQYIMYLYQWIFVMCIFRNVIILESTLSFDILELDIYVLNFQ